MPDAAGFLKSAFAALEPDEALRQPVTSLLGVSSAAQSALEPLGIRTVFDLAASRTFATARALLAIQRDPTSAEARLNVVAADAGMRRPACRCRARRPADRHPARARRGSRRPRESPKRSMWRPCAILRSGRRTRRESDPRPRSFPSRPGFDPEAPADLLPRSGVYPTERIFFSKLVLDAVPEPTEGAQAIEQAPTDRPRGGAGSAGRLSGVLPRAPC